MNRKILAFCLVITLIFGAVGSAYAAVTVYDHTPADSADWKVVTQDGKTGISAKTSASWKALQIFQNVNGGDIGDFVFEADIKLNTVTGGWSSGAVIRFRDNWEVALLESAEGVFGNQGLQNPNYCWISVAPQDIASYYSAWHNVKITAIGQSVTVELDGTVISNGTYGSSDLPASGAISIINYNSTAVFANIKLSVDESGGDDGGDDPVELVPVEFDTVLTIPDGFGEYIQGTNAWQVAAVSGKTAITLALPVTYSTWENLPLFYNVNGGVIGDFVLEMKVRTGTVLGGWSAGAIIRFRDDWEVALLNSAIAVYTDQGLQGSNLCWKSISSGDVAAYQSAWHDVEISAIGQAVTITVDGEVISTGEYSNGLPAEGAISLIGYAAPAAFADIKLTAYLPEEEEPPVPFIPGDIDGDGDVTITDIITLKKAMVADAQGAIEEIGSVGDLDSDGAITAIDICLMKCIILGISPDSYLLSLTPAEDMAPIFQNPGKGFVFYGLPPSDLISGVVPCWSLVYERFLWSEIEPLEGQYNWAVIDSKIQSAKQLGAKYAFGVMAASSDFGPVDGYATPEWVFDAGALYYEVTDSRPICNKIPYWEDNPIFIEKQNQFIEAMGEKYNGNPDIAFIDMRNYGNWGEGHIGSINYTDDDEWISMVPPETLWEDYHLPYITAFPDTQLIMPFGDVYFQDIYERDVEYGVGFRRDGIPDWDDGSQLAFAAGQVMTVTEYTDTLKNMIANNTWDDQDVYDALIRAKVSYTEIGRGSGYAGELNFLTEKSDLMEALANKIGYHFVLEDAQLPAALYSGTPAEFSMTWANKGVTNLFNEPCYTAAALLDSDGNVVDICWLDVLDPHDWAPGQTPVTAGLEFTVADTGLYRLAIGMFLDKGNENPDYKLGISGRTQDGWYVVANAVWQNNAG